VFEASAQNASEVAAAWTPWYARPFVSVNISAGLKQYDNANALQGFEGSVLILSAKKDNTLPSFLSKELHDNLKNAGIDTTYHEFPKATHFDISAQENFVENFVETVKDFLN